MRHYKKGRKLGTDASHTKAMKKNLVVNLFTNDRIKTTLERAKEIRGDVDRVITWAKRGDVHARRLAIAKLGDKDLVAEIFSKVEQGMFEGRPGGYSRILRLGTRRGDSATIVIMELVLEPVSKKAGKDTDEKSGGKEATTKKSSTAKSGKAKAKTSAEKAEDELEAEGDTATEGDAEAEEAVEAEGDAAVGADAEAEEAVEAIEDANAEVAAEPEPEPEPTAEPAPELKPAMTDEPAVELAPEPTAEPEPEPVTGETSAEPEPEANE